MGGPIQLTLKLLRVTPGKQQQRFDGEEQLNGERQHHIWLDGEKWATMDVDKG